MKPKEFGRLVARDSYCLHCQETEAVAPNHRINRGMGGSKTRNHAANYVLICSTLNGLIESDNRWARVAKEYGWKLEAWQDPYTEPVFDLVMGVWYLLDDDFTRMVVDGKGNND
jgi:hypothetical protein